MLGSSRRFQQKEIAKGYFAQLQAPLAFSGSFYNQVQHDMVDEERMLTLLK